MQNVNMAFAERLKELRKAGKLSRPQLAELLGVSVSALGNYERGERTPDALLIVELSRCFSVTSDYLLCLSEQKGYQEQEFEQVFAAGSSSTATSHKEPELVAAETERDVYKELYNSLLTRLTGRNDN